MSSLVLPSTVASVFCKNDAFEFTFNPIFIPPTLEKVRVYSISLMDSGAQTVHDVVIKSDFDKKLESDFDKKLVLNIGENLNGRIVIEHYFKNEGNPGISLWSIKDLKQYAADTMNCGQNHQM